MKQRNSLERANRDAPRGYRFLVQLIDAATEQDRELRAILTLANSKEPEKLAAMLASMLLAKKQEPVK